MDKFISAKLKHLRITPRKTRAVANVIRGLPVEEARGQLMLSSRRVSIPLLKLLQSAIANAKNNFNSETAKLYIKEIRVDQGPKFKRWTPRARGSASTIQKKTSHVTIILGVAENLKQPKFVIAPKPKKSKTPKEKKKEKTQDGFEEKTKEKRQTNKPGFFKKVFRRKSI